MKEKILWWKYRINNSSIGRKLGYSFVKCENDKRKLESSNKINAIIIDKISKNEPLMVARFGSNEAFCCANVLGKKLGAIKYYNKINLKLMENVAGFRPTDDDSLNKFYDLMMESYLNTDIIGIWDQGMQDCLIKFWNNKKIIKTEVKNLEPFVNIENPWSKSLKNKKVLVIHPFAESIQNQYKKRELLFTNKEVLPEFTLLTLKAVQTNASNLDSCFNNWFEALDYMYKETLKIEYDVAIIGCGAYGFPLASLIKKQGKQAIHLGSMVQILFGIKGRRWDIDKTHDYVRKLYNENWNYPLENERPRGSELVENGCYWK